MDSRRIAWLLRLEYTKGEAEALRQLSRAEAARRVDDLGLVAKLFWCQGSAIQ